MSRHARLVNSFLIGCDPEFLVLNADNTVFNVKGKLRKDGLIGWDHDGYVLEARPEPSRGTYRLIHTLQALLVGSPEAVKLSDKRWRAGAMYKLPPGGARAQLTLGGHVHIDLPPNDPAHYERVAVLDTYTKLLEQLDLLPEGETKARRQVEHPDGQIYGRFGDTRIKGQKPRFEYRTMASWLTSPEIAFLALSGAKLAAAHPMAVREALPKVASFAGLRRLFAQFASVDDNARRAIEKVLHKGLAKLQRDPDVDFQGAWKEITF